MVKTVNQLESSRSVVYGILTDFPNYPQWMAGCEKAVVTSAGEGVASVDLTLNSMKRLTMNLKFEFEQDVLVKFELNGPADVKAYAGSYRLMNSEGNNGTTMVTEMLLDAGPMAPKFMVDRMVKKSLEDSGNALKQVAKSKPAGEAAPQDDAPPVGTKKAKRSRCVLRLVKTDSGEEQVWYAGKTFAPK